ncbi:MAG TPA: type II toxin-antitoxin system HicB family antitoxin [Candidatus Hydrogenedentes bacterium]|nr:type II toxin-antitoxin system HicB family antitoxin [Candidatus Hydrogenedentota bacterium]HNT89832.1 type II toxin-antitoxin system HicB family antitoxin [Candidatus Hydrogenedentota bacterium]
MKKHTYRVHLVPEPEGGFTVTVPALPGCVTWGADYEHALAMAREAIQLYLEVLADEGQPIPEEPDSAPLDALVQVTLPVVA